MKPPPSLAKKLGITPETTVRVIGTVDDAALAKALSEAKAVSARDGDVIVARVNSPANLATALARATKGLERGAPIWLIHRKGPGHALNETIVRIHSSCRGNRRHQSRGCLRRAHRPALCEAKSPNETLPFSNRRRLHPVPESARIRSCIIDRGP